MRTAAVLYLNGRRVVVPPEQSGMMLSDFLRYERSLVGTKVVCAEGDCGACSVLRYVPSAKKEVRYLPINSCIITVGQCDGTSLVTVDALAKDEALSPVQSAMVNAHGSQCGFCTPGFVVALTGLVEKKLCAGVRSGACSAREAKNATTGNLCRCTGYQPIIDAATAIDLAKCESVAARYFSKPQAADLRKIRAEALRIETDAISFFAPRKIADAAKALAKDPEWRLLGAATDLGVAVNKGKTRLPKILSLHLVDELYAVKATAKRVTVGARVTLSELRHAVMDRVPEFARFLDLFASPQIKNSATLVGNVANASPIGDTPPFLLVAGAVLHVVGPRAKRKIPLEKFYLGYRRTALKRGELIAAIEFDVPAATESLALFKTSQRKDLDISAVNAAFRIEWANRERTKIKSARIAFGGVAATPIRGFAAEKALAGKTPTPETLESALGALHGAITPMTDLRGTSAFRRVLVENLFAKFFREHSPSSAVGNGASAPR
ncbi:MAG: FAD binding domain-containing protein [Bdellovibrionales bacterium]|nr:FAD binding domain-containing protein [Bdellovibrionales bacterium]